MDNTPDNPLNETVKSWYSAFYAFLKLPIPTEKTIRFGTFSPELIPDLTVKFLSEQAQKSSGLFPSYQDFLAYFDKKLDKPKPLSKVEIELLAEKKWFNWEPDRELFIEWRCGVALRDYEKALQVHEQKQRRLDRFCKRFSKSNLDYLRYLSAHYPPIKTFLKSSFVCAVLPENRNKHSYITGGTGSGKSEAIKYFIHPFLQEKIPSCAVVVIEPHGDLALELAQSKEFYGKDRLVYFDPFLSEGMTPTINPFHFRHKNKQVIDKNAQGLVDVFEQSLASLGAGLTVQMNAVLFPCLTLLLGMDTDITDLQAFMKEKKNNPKFAKMGLDSPIKTHQDFFKNAFWEKSYDTSKHGIYTKIQSLINSYNFYNCVIGQNTIDLENAIEQKKIIIFNLSKGLLGVEASRDLGRFMIARIQAFALSQASVKPQERANIHLFIDECHNYISGFMKEILQESRKYGLFLTLAQQGIGQGMDTKLKEAVLTNAFITMIGENKEAVHPLIHRTTGIKKEVLNSLETGFFQVQIGKSPYISVKIPDFLVGNRNAMTAEQWEETKQEQLKKYYRPLDENEPKRELETSQTDGETATNETKETKKRNEVEMDLWY